ncbi:MAG: tyrosine-type recombinase/integrase [Clostridiaceae bacterium]|nr:tyrosine-type recombinase/integrase [Clostridiaceae bacterium]
MKDIYKWNSDLSEMLVIFLAEKRMTGYTYNAQEKYLRRFDEYYLRNGYSGVHITKSMTDAFIYTVPEEPSTHYIKERLMRDVTMFLIRNGYREVYVPEVKSAPKSANIHTPYIFMEDEMKRIFNTIDSWEDSFYTDRHIIDPIFFRILYGTGMRVSEVLNLLVKDFDSSNGILTVYHAKNNKDRLIPIAPSLTKRIAELSDKIHRYSKDSDFLFPSRTRHRIDQSTIYRRFRQYLHRAGISHTDSGPRVHDLRHNYAVKCLKRWVLAGEELTNILPYLAAYMGHSDFRGTQYYLRLTADLYPNIISREEAEFGYVIPEGGMTDERN